MPLVQQMKPYNESPRERYEEEHEMSLETFKHLVKERDEAMELYRALKVDMVKIWSELEAAGAPLKEGMLASDAIRQLAGHKEYKGNPIDVWCRRALRAENAITDTWEKLKSVGIYSTPNRTLAEAVGLLIKTLNLIIDSEQDTK